jgi:hypothetical protein
VFGELDSKNAKKLHDEWKANTLNQDLYSDWIAAFENDAFVQKISKNLQELHHQVFVDVQIKPFDF